MLVILEAPSYSTCAEVVLCGARQLGSTNMRDEETTSRLEKGLELGNGPPFGYLSAYGLQRTGQVRQKQI